MDKDLGENVERLLKEGPRIKPVDIEGYITLEDVSCVGADGNVFECYDRLYVARDVVRNNGNRIHFSPYQAVSHFERQRGSMFLPSFALSCNILARLFESKDDPEFNDVLLQYKDYGPGHGWHAQNTIVDWKDRKIIHYPKDSDFPSDGGNDNINQNKKKITFSFNPKCFDDLTIEKALKKSDFEKYIKNLTGLKNPEVLIEIGDYFQTPVKVWVPINPENSDYTSSAWLGAGGSFDIGTCNDLLISDDVARWVLF